MNKTLRRTLTPISSLATRPPSRPPSPRARPQRAYHPPVLVHLGPLQAIIRGASWKGVDSNGQIDPENHYPA